MCGDGSGTFDSLLNFGLCFGLEYAALAPDLYNALNTALNINGTSSVCSFGAVGDELQEVLAVARYASRGGRRQAYHIERGAEFWTVASL